MIPTITTEEFTDALCSTPLTLYPSVYAYSAFETEHEEPSPDQLVLMYYLHGGSIQHQ